MTACECCGNTDAGYRVCPDCLSDPCDHGAEPREDVFLVAFTVSGGKSRDDAQDVLIAALRHRLQLGPRPFGNPTAYVEEWWVAEDDRRDHSDNDSATFVPYRPTRGGAVAS